MLYLSHRVGNIVDTLLEEVRACQVGGEGGHAPPGGGLDDAAARGSTFTLDLSRL